MKYLRSYSKLFESIDLEEIKEKEDVLRDLSLPLWDDDFNVQIHFMRDVWFEKDEVIQNGVINVNISRKGEFRYDDQQRFWFDDIKDTVLEMVDFMGGEENCSVSIPDKHVENLVPAVIVNGYLLSKYKRIKIDYKLSNIILRFKV